jgi:endonuclease/exonuclease/phosphatase family metal-dependent hydrolase
MVLSGLACVLLMLCYAIRPDSFTALTVFPVWTWLVPGLFLLRLAWFRSSTRGYKLGMAAVGLLWLAYILTFTEELRSVTRSLWPEQSRPGSALRVVSLNSELGLGNASDLKGYMPDIVLLQESPGPTAVERMAHEVFGAEAGVVMGIDTAILARGTVVIVPLPLASRRYFAVARVKLTTGIEIGVISLHLQTPPVRLDLWSPGAWTQLRAHRARQRRQMQTILQQIAAMPANMPIIAGGDFNAPQGDAIFQLLKPQLRDAFAEAGRGWGNTHDNDLPVLRIDQVWITNHFGAAAVRTYRTERSDHRLVVCDLWFR